MAAPDLVNLSSLIDDGFRESEQSWHELLVRLRDVGRGTVR